MPYLSQEFFNLVLAHCTSETGLCFRNYLLKHQHRIPNYDYYAAEDLCSMGSGAVESLVKQIDQRLQIVSRWKAEHVPKVLAQRCAYLNEDSNRLLLFSQEGDTLPFGCPLLLSLAKKVS